MNKKSNTFKGFIVTAGVANAFFASIILGYVATTTLQAQEINFGEFSSKYGVSIIEVNPGEDLNFGSVLQNEGVKEITLLNSKVIAIEGVKYLDIIVEIIAEPYLYLNGDVNCPEPTCRIPFTLQTAYANNGSNNQGEAVLIQSLSNVASAQFPILARQNQPPGPPPTPDYEGYNPSLFNESAYLYIYGSINVGNVDTGSYSSDIIITVTYD